MDFHSVVTEDKNTIEYYTNGIESSKTPVVISMGNWEPAFRAFPIMKAINDRKVYALSYRGRGKSTSPEKGYDWKDHAHDLNAVITTNSITKALFIAFSKGVSYTLGFLEMKPEIAKGIILVDYPAIHCLSKSGYAEYWYNLKYRDYNLKDYISKRALEGIEKESTFRDFYPLITKLECPVSIFVGRKSNAEIESNLSEDDLLKYRNTKKDIEIVKFYESGHMIFDDEMGKAKKEVSRIISKNDLTQVKSMLDGRASRAQIKE